MANKHAEIARNEAAAINKLHGTITLYEYFGLTVLYCKNKQITARRANKKQDLNLASLNILIKKYGQNSDIGMKVVKTIQNCRNPLMHNTPEQNELIDIGRLHWI